jgi:hypothetical protein
MMQKLQKLNKLVGILFSIFLVSVATPGFTQQAGLNFISEIKGNVEIKRTGRKNYQRVFVGDFLNPSDKLRLAQGTSAKVVCNNLLIWDLGSKGEFEVSKGCPSITPPILRPQSSVDITRGLDDPKIPYLISPRNTAILTQQPTLRWNPVQSATSYKVQMSGEGVNWTTQVSQSTVVYSGNQPLQSGFIYEVNITANNGASTKDIDAPVFTVLSDSDVQQVKTEIAQLQQKLLSNESKDLALAHLYRSNDLNADAIDLLEGLVKKGSQTTAVYQLLGSIYQQVGLNRLARERYLIALKLAKAENNLEGQAIIQASLKEFMRKRVVF